MGDLAQTAWLTAYPRTFTDIPFCNEIFEGMESNLRSQQQEFGLELKMPTLAPELEARFKLVTNLLRARHATQILEIASGFSPRGLLMSENPHISYVELELPEMAIAKRIVLDHVISRMGLPRPQNLRVIEGNALIFRTLAAAVEYFREDREISIVNEGLLRYLSLHDRRKIASNIHLLLTRYGGVWITPDITLRRYLEAQDKSVAPEFNEHLSKATQTDIYGHSFDDEGQAIQFFEDMGFSVKRHNLNEVVDQLVSPSRLSFSDREVEEMIGTAVVFVMSVSKYAN
jgi:O-methyltransferase involved in polyketide biosynthesis